MRISQPKPTLLILEHGPWRNLFAIFAIVVALVLWAFAKGLATGLVVSLLCIGFAWLGARRFEQVRVVFDRTSGRVDIQRRTSRYGSGAAAYDLDEIGHVETEVSGSGKHKMYQLVLVIPTGPHAGRHPLSVFEIQDKRTPELATAINYWLKKKQ